MSEGPQSGQDEVWLVVAADVEEPRLEGPMTEPELETRLRALWGQRVCAFPFRGRPYHISHGPLRYLLTPDGRSVPLFPDPEVLEPDRSGMLYDPNYPAEDSPAAGKGGDRADNW